MSLKMVTAFVITFIAVSLSSFIVYTTSYFQYSDAMDKTLCDKLLIDFVYYILYVWIAFKFISEMKSNVLNILVDLNLIWPLEF